MNNIFLFIILSLLLSLAIDLSVGEVPSMIHPVVLIGNMTNYLKKIFININNRLSGLFVVLIETCISSVLIYLLCLFLSFNIYLLFIIYTILLSTTFSVKMLLQTAENVKNDLDVSIDKARESVSYLVSRDTNKLSESFIVSATIESLTENITDSYTAVVFYYLIFALLLPDWLFLPLLIAFLYRISNTLDAMLGYKTDDLINIGFIPAKLDDVLNYIPSRLSGLFIVFASYLLKYNWKRAYKVMMRDTGNCPSPNSGYTMAPTAGALDIQLVKKDTYVLGDDLNEITKDDITRAVKLTKMTLFLFTVFSTALFTVIFAIT